MKRNRSSSPPPHITLSDQGTVKRQKYSTNSIEHALPIVPKNTSARSLFDTLSDSEDETDHPHLVEPHSIPTWTPATHHNLHDQQSIDESICCPASDYEDDLDLSFDVRKLMTSSQFELIQNQQPVEQPTVEQQQLQQTPECTSFSLRDHVQSAMLSSTTNSRSVVNLDHSLDRSVVNLDHILDIPSAVDDDSFQNFHSPTSDIDSYDYNKQDHEFKSNNYLTAPSYFNTNVRTGINHAGSTVYFPARSFNTPIVYSNQGKQYNTVIQDAQFIASFRQIEEQVDLEIHAAKQTDYLLNTQPRPILPPPDACKKADQLWVDQYHPQSYMDLISNESVARQVLSWVHAWDVCVFRSKLKKRKPVQPTTQQGHSIPLQPPSLQHSGGNKTTNQSKKPNVKSNHVPFTSLNEIELTPNDPLHRPLRRILLLSGSPGLGKSTLIQIIAKQAGYDVTEINASDDRTSRTVTDRLNAAMSSATITNGKISRRPRLVVMDEIDGAASVGSEGTNMIKLLLQVAMTSRRPIICICNDSYAPVLRPLRLVSELVTMYRPNSHDALVRRLAGICVRENIKISRQSLHWLSESAQGDIRSSIHALQFASRQHMKNTDTDPRLNQKRNMTVVQKPVLITKEMLQKAQLATKDAGPGGGMPFMWDAMFSTQTADKLASEMGMPNLPLTSLACAIDRHSEFEKVAVGCLEYAVLVETPEFECVAGALNQLSKVDVMIATRHRTGHHSMDSAIPWALARVHSYFQGGLAAVTGTNPWSRLITKSGGGKLEYPKVDYEAYLRTRDFANTVMSFRYSVAPQCAVSVITMTSLALATDVLGGGLLAQIVSPQIQHANYRIMSDRDRARILRLVELLSGLGVKLITKSDLSFRLEPPLEVLCGLTLSRGKLQMLLPKNQAVRELLSAELKSAAISPVTSKISEKAVPTDGMVLKDFFGRPKVLAEEVPCTGSQIPELRISKITFKFHEGYSNAVRRPVYMKDLL